MDCSTLLVKHCFCGCGCDHNANGNGGVSDEMIVDLQKELAAVKEKVEGISECSCEGISGGGSIGEIFWWPTITPPGDSLYCNGSSVSREKYKDLFDVIGATFGSEDDASFNLPDLRGEFIRGYDLDKVRDPQGSTRGIGKHQDATQIPRFYVWGQSGVPYAYPVYPNINNTNTGMGQLYEDSTIEGTQSDVNGQPGVSATASAPQSYNWYTIRPTNVNLLPCIRYKGTAESN